MKNLKKAIGVLKEFGNTKFEVIESIIDDKDNNLSNTINIVGNDGFDKIDELYSALGKLEHFDKKTDSEKKIECTEDLLVDLLYLNAVVEMEKIDDTNISIFSEAIFKLYNGEESSDETVKLVMEKYGNIVDGNNIDDEYANKIISFIEKNLSQKRKNILERIEEYEEMERAIATLIHIDFSDEELEYSKLSMEERLEFYEEA